MNVSHRVLVTSPTLADRPGRKIIISSEITGQIQQLHFFFKATAFIHIIPHLEGIKHQDKPCQSHIF